MILLAALLATLLTAGAPALAAEACAAPVEVPDTLQVAWVSRLGARAGAHTALPVVRVADLRKLVEEQGRDATKVLRALGAIGPRATASGVWKVTVFDVKREWVCRGIPDSAENVVAGVAVCPSDMDGIPSGIRARSWSGCGYLLDSASGARTLDVFRIEWEAAVAWGFCVLPLDRFLAGA